MSTYVVKINRKSIKKNPNAGATRRLAEGPVSTTITISGAHESLESDDVKMIQRSSSCVKGGSADIKTTYAVAGMSFKAQDKFLKSVLKKFGAAASYVIENNCHVVDTWHPEPAYLFKYAPLRVRCAHCDASFSYKKLRDEDDYDDDEVSYRGRSNICPVCHRDDACELAFEDIGDVLLSIHGIPKTIVRG
jgi:hypothetical protein